MIPSAANRFAPKALSILRIVTGSVFCEHGFQKIFGLLGGLGRAGATAKFPTEFWFAGMLELVGGLLILLGLFTPCVAFVLCGEMAVAFFTAHFPRGFWPVRNGGEPAVLYCFIFLYLVFAGGGPWSLDALLRKTSP